MHNFRSPAATKTLEHLRPHAAARCLGGRLHIIEGLTTDALPRFWPRKLVRGDPRILQAAIDIDEID